MSGIQSLKKIGVAIVCIAVLCGCGSSVKVPEIVKESSLVISADQKLTLHLVDAFDKSYYDVDGLKVMATEEVEQYHEAMKDDASTVVLKRVESVEGSSELVVVTYDFQGQKDYKSFVGKDFFYGTVEEAKQAGYDFVKLNQVLHGVAKEDTIVSGTLAEGGYEKKHVILLEENMKVYAPAKAAYISEDAEVMEDGSVDTTGVSGQDFPVIILLER